MRIIFSTCRETTEVLIKSSTAVAAHYVDIIPKFTESISVLLFEDQNREVYHVPFDELEKAQKAFDCIVSPSRQSDIRYLQEDYSAQEIKDMNDDVQKEWNSSFQSQEVDLEETLASAITEDLPQN